MAIASISKPKQVKEIDEKKILRRQV